MENRKVVIFDDAHVFSWSGKAYPRVTCRGREEIGDKRFPFLKRTLAKGRSYVYFACPRRARLFPLPPMESQYFDYAYLSQLAEMEGKSARSKSGLPEMSKNDFLRSRSGVQSLWMC